VVNIAAVGELGAEGGSGSGSADAMTYRPVSSSSKKSAFFGEDFRLFAPRVFFPKLPNMTAVALLVFFKGGLEISTSELDASAQVVDLKSADLLCMVSDLLSFVQVVERDTSTDDLLDSFVDCLPLFFIHFPDSI
jgi:hypothetical protein